MSETFENEGYKFIRARKNGEKNRPIENHIGNLSSLVEKIDFAKEKKDFKTSFWNVSFVHTSSTTKKQLSKKQTNFHNFNFL